MQVLNIKNISKSAGEEEKRGTMGVPNSGGPRGPTIAKWVSILRKKEIEKYEG